jgi:hypothetical protein
MADISILSIKIFAEVSKIGKKTVRVLYIVLKVLSNEKIKKYIAISLLILVTGYTFAGKLQYLIS